MASTPMTKTFRLDIIEDQLDQFAVYRYLPGYSIDDRVLVGIFGTRKDALDYIDTIKDLPIDVSA